MSRWRGYLLDDGAQASTEYILILSIAVMLAIMVIKQLIKPLYDRLAKTLSSQIDNALFKGDLHRLKVGQ